MASGLRLPKRLEDYDRLISSLDKETPKRRASLQRVYARYDLYYLLRYVFNRADVQDEWLFARCREVQADPNGCLDLWARNFYKSTIITYALTIQDILSSHGSDPDPKWGGIEPTFGIFSHTRPIAKSFLRQIKREFESNELLPVLFPDICWKNPEREAPKWSEDDGLILRRNSNPKESTVEAWGMVDGQPTGKHFYLLIYDDVVTDKSVFSPDMMRKTTGAWELSVNLGMRDSISRYIGTRYHHNDTYREILARKVARPRLKPATDDGTAGGKPVFVTQKELDLKRAAMGPYIYSCQMLLNPLADEVQGFKPEWIRYYEKTPSSHEMNKYILADPANEKKRESDYTAFWVIGLNADNNVYILDAVRDRLRLTERANKLFELHRKWKPIDVIYEKYGLQADVEHYKDRMERENYRFTITEVGGQMAKPDRIRRLIPKFEQGRMWFPHFLWVTMYDGEKVNLIQRFIEDEFIAFPVGVHEDMLDALSRIEDAHLIWPASTWQGSLPEVEVNII